MAYKSLKCSFVNIEAEQEINMFLCPNTTSLVEYFTSRPIVIEPFF